MRQGYLSEYFEGVAAKRLSAVEAHPERSHQHEFNGVQGMQAVLGTCTAEHQRFTIKFIYLSDIEDPVVENAYSTWYDSRANQPHRSKECRLYFQTTTVSEMAEEGDVLVLGKLQSGPVIAIVASAGSTAEHQLLWLFGLTELTEGVSVKPIEEIDEIPLQYAAKLILEELGIEEEETEQDSLETILRKFGGTFPTTREFSAFAREAVMDANALENPDSTLVAWMEKEDALFRTLERHLVMEHIQVGFTDVDEFMQLSLAVQNRRKSRAGQALENHFEQILIENGLRYSRGKETENRSRPDFIFPSIEDYRNSTFHASDLTMLGAKTTCKDRWRQVLAEANRIDNKHLLTFQPGISVNQTDEMRANRLSLVVPEPLHETYIPVQQAWLLNVSDFLELVRQREIAP
ncbi:MAG: type II restriction endonuclease [Thermoleophilia bacterium]